jgi:hypothetical protein
MRHAKLLAVAATSAVLAFAVPANAAVVACTTGPVIDLTVNQCTYPNPPSGQDPKNLVELAIFEATGINVSLTLYGKSDDNPGLFSFNPDVNGGEFLTTDWSVLDGTLIKYISVKTGDDDFKVYEWAGLGASSGTVTTEGLAVGRNNNQPAISHLSFWTVTPSIPEPATWALMLLGFGAIGWGMRRRNAAEPRMRFSYN